MSKMSDLVARGRLDAPCVVLRLEGALEPLISLKKFTESMVELRGFRFLEGDILARSKALVRGRGEGCWQCDRVQLKGSSSGDLPPAQRHPALGPRSSPQLTRSPHSSCFSPHNSNQPR